jgi:hypothetical protein
VICPPAAKARTSSAKKPHRATRHSAAAQTVAGLSLLGGSARLVAGLSGPLTELSRQALDSLIGTFPVPPFLLPIYQAAGIEYGVPWQVLAGINEIETDFGRNLSVSSAGAVGWMQFLPSTWAKYGLDADGRGTANPYDPVDAIFSAARYLAAAGGAGNLPKAIWAYNHANWYVDSVELRARLLQLLPASVVDGLSGLMESDYPVAGHLASYATLAPKRVKISGQPALELPAPAGAPVIAAADGRVVAIGEDSLRGRYITIEDSYGDRYTYEQLGSVQTLYPLVRPRVGSPLSNSPAISGVANHQTHLFSTPATVLTQAQAAAPASGSGGRGTSGARVLTAARFAGFPTYAVSAAGVPAPTYWAGGPPQSRLTRQAVVPKQRLFADPSRPASYAAGGSLQLQSRVTSYAAATNLQVTAGPDDYFSQPSRLTAQDVVLAPMQPGALVLAGTILGHVAPVPPGSGTTAVLLQVRPAGSNAPVDPTPLVAGWKLLGRLTAGHHAVPGLSEGGAYGSTNPTLGQLLLAAPASLEQAVLADSRVTLDGCEGNGISSGAVDRRVLAVIEYLSYSGLAPTVTGLPCTSGGGEPSGTSLQITALGGVLVAGNQQRGGIVDRAIRLLLGLRGALHPARVISLLSYPWQATALSLPDHAAALEVDMTAGARPSAASASPAQSTATAFLSTGEWARLIGQLSQVGG